MLTVSNSPLSERCRSALKMLEVNLRENITKPELHAQFIFADIALPGGKNLHPLAEVEVLDTIASYFASKCDDDVKFRVFCELFPLDGECRAYQLDFLVKLSSLALSVGLPILLDYSAIWLKVRIAQVFGFHTPRVPDSDPVIAHRLVQTYIAKITRDLLSMHANLPEANVKSHDSADPLTHHHHHHQNHHPFVTLPSHSPLFADAYFSGVTVTYGFHPFLVSSIRSSPNAPMKPLGFPPAPVVNVLSQWMQLARLPHKPPHHHHHHSPNWTALDWSVIFRRHTLGLFVTHSSVDQLLASLPSPPVLLAWWTVFSPCGIGRSNPSKECSLQNEDLKLSNALADIHYELLQCLLEPGTAPQNSGHRHNPGGGGGGGSSASPSSMTWHVTCVRKMEHTTDFHCLGHLVRSAAELLGAAVDREVTNHDDTELARLRLAEFLQIAWVSGKIRGLSSDEFVKLLSPLDHHKLFDMIVTRLRK